MLLHIKRKGISYKVEYCISDCHYSDVKDWKLFGDIDDRTIKELCKSDIHAHMQIWSSQRIDEIMQEYWVKHGYGKYSNVYPSELHNGDYWLKVYMQGNLDWASDACKGRMITRCSGRYITSTLTQGSGRKTKDKHVTWSRIRKDYPW